MLGSYSKVSCKLDCESDDMKIVTVHQFGDKRDNISALVLTEPFWYTILKLNPCIAKAH